MRRAWVLAWAVIGCVARTGANGAEAFRDGAAFPPVAALPSDPALPDPLRMLDGRRVTTRDQWVQERRPELVGLFQHYMYGELPPAPKVVTGRIEREDARALDGRATLREVTIEWGVPELSPIHLLLVVPNGRSGLAPVILALNYFGNHTLVRDSAMALSTNWMPERGEGVVAHRSTEASRGTWATIWPIGTLIERGYAVATFYNGDVDPDRPEGRGIQDYYRRQDPRWDCGTIAAWAWGLQRAVDYLVTCPEVDRGRIVVTGHSRLGKAALLAAALDERIAMAIPHQAGCGGSAPSRSTLRPPPVVGAGGGGDTGRPPETVKQINDAFPHWFAPRFMEFNDRPDRLPIDQHCLVALCAPRPVLFTNGRQDRWINPEGQFEVLRGAAPVYRLLGAGGFDATQLPADGEFVGGALGYFVRPGGHSLTAQDWRAFLDFADRELATSVEVPRWGMHEWEFHGRCRGENPFRDARLWGEFTSPSGRAVGLEGFFDGGDVWRLRFAPDEVGTWRFRVWGEGVEIAATGRLRCVAPRSPGFLGIPPDNPYAFAWSDGTPFLPMGDTCYGLYDDSSITPEGRAEYLETRRAQRFNFVRMSVGHSEARAAADPAYWAWGGTPERPDLDRLNPVFFQGLDGLFRDLGRRGMNVELILFNYYRRPFTDPQLWTAGREALWLRHLVARYAGFSHLFLWTLANEYETHPDGRYRLDRPDDVDWARATARRVKALDPYDHLVTVHPVVSSSAQGPSPRDPFERPWRIGGFFGDVEGIDVLSQQTGQHGEGTRWDAGLQCWVGDDRDLVASVRADRRYGKPVLNSENGYEYLRGHPTERQQVHHTDKVRRSAWRIVCAGGYFAAGFHGTIGHGDVWNRIDAPNQYAFTVRSEGAADQLRFLHALVSDLPYWRMTPFEGVMGEWTVALAEPGRVYLVYLPQGGRVRLDLRSAMGPLEARRFNPRTGQWEVALELVGGQWTELTAPSDADWAWLVRPRGADAGAEAPGGSEAAPGSPGA